MNGVDFNTAVANAVAEMLSTAAQGSAVLAVLFAVPLSLGVLALVRYRILRSMTRKGHSTSAAGSNQDSASSQSGRAPRPSIEWRHVNQAAIGHRAGLARLYVGGGVGLAVALAVVDAATSAGDSPFSPLRFVFAALCFTMPLALTLRLLYGRWKPTFAIVGWQLAAIIALGILSPQHSDQPPTVAILVAFMLALLLHPRIRAMAPLATGFLTLVFAAAAVSMAASLLLLRDYIQTNILANPRTKQLLEGFDEAFAMRDEQRLQGVNDMAASLFRDHGLFIVQTFAIVVLSGVLVAALIGTLLFLLVTRSYARKRLSEQWLVIASIWLYLSIAVASIHSPLGLAANLACFAVFGVAVAAGWRRLPQLKGSGVRLLLLRSFTLGERSNRLFQDLEALWRSVGSMQLVGAADIALTTLEPHELLDFVRGCNGREFVHTQADVDACLASFDHNQDPDGRFRVNVIFCGSDLLWKYAVNQMLLDTDCVLMDLRGFSRHRAGCVFEIRCLAESGLPFRTVFLVDESTDQDFIGETWGAAKRDRPGANSHAFELVAEQPFDMTISERIITAFSRTDGGSAVSS